MEYQCIGCGWSGDWVDLIHETLCPHCRCATRPKEDDSRAA